MSWWKKKSAVKDEDKWIEGTKKKMAELNRENRRWAGKGKCLTDGQGWNYGKCVYCLKNRDCLYFHPQLEAISEVELVCSDCFDTNSSFLVLRKKWKKWILEAPILRCGWGAEDNKCVFCKKTTYCFPFHPDLNRKSPVVGVCEKCSEVNLEYLTLKDKYTRWIDEYGKLCHGHNIKHHPGVNLCERC